MECNSQELFLFEFLIDCVNIPAVEAMHDDVLPMKTCIEFKILSLPPIYICQETPTARCTCKGEEPQIFRKGKSCLFALPSKLLQKPICSFPIVMTVYKKLPPSVLPDVMTIGTCSIEGRDMVNSLLCDPGNPVKMTKNRYRICTATGQNVGEVSAFIRFSRLGNKVITQFQNPHNRKPYLFKGMDDSPVFQCRRVPEVEGDPFDSCICSKNDCKTESSNSTCCSPTTAKQACPNKKKKAKSKRSCCPPANEKSGCGKPPSKA